MVESGLSIAYLLYWEDISRPALADDQYQGNGSTRTLLAEGALALPSIAAENARKVRLYPSGGLRDASLHFLSSEDLPRMNQVEFRTQFSSDLSLLRFSMHAILTILPLFPMTQK